MKRKLYIAILESLLCAGVISCSATYRSSSTSSSSVPPASADVFALWPNLSGRIGSYDAQTAGDVTEMAKSGLSMLVGGSVSSSALLGTNVRQIDVYPWYLVVKYGCAEYYSKNATRCRVSEEASSFILSQMQAHLALQRSNRNVIAYWFLDDYPGGDISTLLGQMHALLVDSNNDLVSSFPRPAICGFGGNIALANSARIGRTDPVLSYFRSAIANFRPTYCDIVALYPYAVNTSSGPNDPSQYDWTMTQLLPAMFALLEEQGWNPSAEPLIGIAQAFGYDRYVAPSEADLVAEITAYCKAGAIAILAYSWNDGVPSLYPKSSAEPVNSIPLRNGLSGGLKACQSYWPAT